MGSKPVDLDKYLERLVEDFEYFDALAEQNRRISQGRKTLASLKVGTGGSLQERRKTITAICAVLREMRETEVVTYSSTNDLANEAFLRIPVCLKCRGRFIPTSDYHPESNSICPACRNPNAGGPG